MKRILTLALLLSALFSAYAAGYNSQQKALLTAIEKNLKAKGLSPEQVNDGLKFISDNDTYYIELDESETNPMYVRLRRYVKFDDNIKREDIMEQLLPLNARYTVKAFCKEKNLIFSAEMFVTTADQFNYAFNDMLSLMKKAYASIE